MQLICWINSGVCLIFVDLCDWPQPPLDVTVILYLYLREVFFFCFLVFIQMQRSSNDFATLAFCYCFSLFPDYFFTSHRVTSGAENTLFHYLSWDSFHGIVVCPRDGDTPSAGATVHAEVVSTFHKTCLSMRRLFSSYYKQVSCK